MLELGKVSLKEHGLIGKQVNKLRLEYLYTFGPDSKETNKSAGKLKHNKHYTNKELLIKDLLKNIRNNDILYIKGSRGMKMEEVVNALVTLK
jgi:UDP-N-acetylmuramoyl-tripeptide--D-alanyl-D-alanine ligase